MPNKAQESTLKYWQVKVGQYIRRKREDARLSQEEVLGPQRRNTVQKIEQGVTNFEVSTLLEILNRVNGDLSEAFSSGTPSRYRHLPHRRLLDQIIEVLEHGDEICLTLLQSATRTAYERLQKHRREQGKRQ